MRRAGSRECRVPCDGLSSDFIPHGRDLCDGMNLNLPLLYLVVLENDDGGIDGGVALGVG